MTNETESGSFKLTSLQGVNREDLLNCLIYCRETGNLTWKSSGARATDSGSGGYYRITVLGRRLYAHRVIVFMVTGEVPEEVDHRDGDHLNLKWDNLRPATGKINRQNIQGATKRSSTGLLGAYARKDGRFESTIRVDGRLKRIGIFNTAEEAHSAHLEARRTHYEGNTL